jgi:hypothetical protein
MEHWLYYIELLIPEVTTFAGVRIKSRYQYPWLADAESLFEILVQNTDNPLERVLIDSATYLSQREMRCRQSHSETGTCQHHDGAGRCQISEELGVSGKADSGVIDNAFVNRSGDQSTEFAGETAVNSASQCI